MLEHAAALDAPRGPQADLSERYAAMLARLTQSRGGPPIWPYLASGLGNGPWVELADGSVKLDMIGGIGVHGAGHSDPRLLEAAVDGALEDTVMQGNLQQHPPGIRLSEQLIGLASAGGADLPYCMLSTIGAMANENALKIALHRAAPADRVL